MMGGMSGLVVDRRASAGLLYYLVGSRLCVLLGFVYVLCCNGKNSLC
jgi:hypothetical protein